MSYTPEEIKQLLDIPVSEILQLANPSIYLQIFDYKGLKLCGLVHKELV